MIDKTTYYEYNPWWEGSYTPKDIIPRPYFHEKLLSLFKNKQVVFMTGFGRVGKKKVIKKNI